MKTMEKGFTLIELLIVIGIIAILAAAIIIAVAPGEQLANAREAAIKAQMQSVATAAYNCLIEKDGTTACETVGDLDIPTPDHPVDGGSYSLSWAGGRVTVSDSTSTVDDITY